jgi:hypothetical protein
VVERFADSASSTRARAAIVAKRGEQYEALIEPLVAFVPDSERTLIEELLNSPTFRGAVSEVADRHLNLIDLHELILTMFRTVRMTELLAKGSREGWCGGSRMSWNEERLPTGLTLSVGSRATYPQAGSFMAIAA